MTKLTSALCAYNQDREGPRLHDAIIAIGPVDDVPDELRAMVNPGWYPGLQ
jgi:hypothetical protein